MSTKHWKRALIASSALSLAALAPGRAALAWSVPDLAGSSAAAPSTSGAAISFETPLAGVSEQLDADINEFSAPMMPPAPMMGTEMLHWVEMLAVVAAPVGALASGGGGGGGGGGLETLFQHPFPGFKGGQVGSPVVPTPEPSSIWLFAVASVVSLGALVRRRARTAEATHDE